MEVTVSSNGKLVMQIAKPKGAVQEAALATFIAAIGKKQTVQVTATADAVVLSVEE